MCRMFNMISGLSRCFIDFFHAVSRRWNLILCILELGSVAVSTLRLETTCGLWISSKQQNRPSRKKWESFSHWFHPICLAEILTGLRGGAIFHYLFIYFLNLQWSGYATDEASLFRAQPVVAATVAVNMSNRVSHVEQVWRSDAVELCCFQLFFFFFFFNKKSFCNSWGCVTPLSTHWCFCVFWLRLDVQNGRHWCFWSTRKIKIRFCARVRARVAIVLLQWACERRASPFIFRASVSIQYLSCSRVHWLHL